MPFGTKENHNEYQINYQINYRPKQKQEQQKQRNTTQLKLGQENGSVIIKRFTTQELQDILELKQLLLEQNKNIIAQMRSLEPLILKLTANIPEDELAHIKELQNNYKTKEEENESNATYDLELFKSHFELLDQY
jgi:hypothetical protein